MSAPLHFLQPFKDAVSDALRLGRDGFVRETIGPLLLIRVHGQEPGLLDLGRVMKSGRRDVIVGRSPDADILVLKKDISNKHAKFELLEDSWTVCDLDSTNGSIAERPLIAHRPVELKDRLKISFGDSVQVQVWYSRSLYDEIVNRRSDRRRESKEIAASRSEAGSSSNIAMGATTQAKTNRRLSGSLDPSKSDEPPPLNKRRLTSRKIYHVVDGKSRDLTRFAVEIQAMSSETFLKQFPCPFLILLASSTARFLDPSDETCDGLDLVQNQGLRSLSYWPLGSRGRLLDVAFGRSSQCDLILDHHTISKVHAMFRSDLDTDRWTIENYSPKNPILIDGEATRGEVVLEDELIFRFGVEIMVQFMLPSTFFKFAKLYADSQSAPPRR